MSLFSVNSADAMTLQGMAPAALLSTAYSRIEDLIRNVLQILLKQTGINAGVNAFADTIEDSTGITAGSSYGYLFDGANKSFKVSAETYPVLNTTYNTSYALETYSKIAQSFTVATKDYIVKLKSMTWSGFSGVVNYRIETDNAGKPSGTLAAAGAYANSVSMSSAVEAVGTLVTPFLPNTGTTYWFVIELVSGTVHVDANSASVYAGGNAATYSAGTWTAVPAYDLYFGVAQGGYRGNLVWNTQTATGQISKAVIESIEVPGTGSVTYSISRDNGVTFTTVPKGVITDISGQPAGTNIIAKAIIAGNAELKAIAYGGEL